MKAGSLSELVGKFQNKWLDFFLNCTIYYNLLQDFIQNTGTHNISLILKSIDNLQFKFIEITFYRAYHRQIEKRRRNKISSLINEIGSLVPMCMNATHRLDKLSMLELAVQQVSMITSMSINSLVLVSLLGKRLLKNMYSSMIFCTWKYCILK